MKKLTKIVFALLLLCAAVDFGFADCSALEKDLDKLDEEYKATNDAAKKKQIDEKIEKILEQMDKCK